MATHKPQVYIDLSGWSPKYFPPILVQYANTLLKDKVLFGTDFPMLTPKSHPSLSADVFLTSVWLLRLLARR